MWLDFRVSYCCAVCDRGVVRMKTILGQNITTLRKLKGLTLQELADKTGTSKSYIWELENLDKVPSVYLISKIAKVLGRSTDKLLQNVTEKGDLTP
jgi:transcriptional regulator with XRE-family HTH domain